jgi:predicted metal-binding protein
VTAAIHICQTCLDRDASKAGAEGTQDFARALEALLARMPEGVDFQLVRQSCLGMCKPDANVAVTGPGRWAWLFHGLQAGADLAEFAAFLALWHAEPQGLPPKQARPPGLRRKTAGRLPPGSGVG